MVGDDVREGKTGEGASGRNAARETGEEMKMRWNGIGSVILKTRGFGRYS